MVAIAFPIVKYAQRVLSSLHLSAVKTISLLMWALAQVRQPNLSEWARRLRLYQKLSDGTEKPYSFKAKKFRIWRFLTRSVWGAKEAWEALTHQLLDPRDVPEDRAPLLVTLDWTKLGDGFWALVLALPYHGRALPLAVEVIAEGFLENMMTDLEIGLVKEFLGWLSPSLKARVVILADRGFAKTELMEAIEEEGASYVIRLHRDAHILIDGQWMELRTLPVEPGQSRSYPKVPYTQEHQKILGVAVRRLPPGQANDPQDDTWYLATNRPELSQATAWYSRRFKEEELFKDWKSMLDLAAHQLTHEEGLDRLVVIVGLYYVFVVLEGQAKTTAARLRQVTQDRKGKPELGIFRQAQAVLDLWAMEAPCPSVDVLMPSWVQVHG